MNKEQIYDEKISPLMKQIIAICKENKIPMIASFGVPNEEHEDLCCTSALLEADFDPPEKFIRACDVIKSRPSIMTSMIVTSDGK